MASRPALTGNIDANLLYSCALYERADDSLEAAQVNKLRTICRKLDLRPGDHVLEIGSGWGGFAMYASTRYGCRVTTTKISREQHAYARTTKLSLFHQAQIGTHYARTLHAWRDRFHARLHEVRAQGFDERFIRMWDMYLGYCEAAFLERHIGDVQLLLTKAQNHRHLYGEPWGDRGAEVLEFSTS